MNKSNPWKSGAAFAITLAAGYTICAIAYALAPDTAIDFLNALFHGLDFRKLGSPAPFTFLMFVYPLIVFAAWGFLVGSFFAWLHNKFQQGRGPY